MKNNKLWFVVFFLLCAIATSCSNDSRDVTVNLNKGTLSYKNVMPLNALVTGISYDIWDEFKLNMKKKKSKGRNLTVDELSLDKKFVNDQNRLLTILNQEFESEPHKKRPFFWGSISYIWSNGVTLGGTGSRSNWRLKLIFDIDKVKFMPELEKGMDFNYVKSILHSNIIRESRFDPDSTDLEANFSGTKVIFNFAVDADKIKSNSRVEDFTRNDLRLLQISVDLSERLEDSSSRNSQPVSKPSMKFSTGDRVYANFENGAKCKATVLIAGNKQSKIEYNEWCETGFISSKSKGEEEWAPNHALTSR